jgi:hypothetical protein
MPARLNVGPLPDAMSLPGYRLRPLKGERKGIRQFGCEAVIS